MPARLRDRVSALQPARANTITRVCAGSTPKYWHDAHEKVPILVESQLTTREADSGESAARFASSIFPWAITRTRWLRVASRPAPKQSPCLC